jgi:hypothetical protein
MWRNFKHAAFDHCFTSLQAGEVDAVLKLGERVLETSESRALRRDILLSMALAHCNLATRALERDTSVG